MATHTSSTETSRVRPSSLGGVALVVASIALSIASYGSLGNTVRIRWTFGTYHHYGPEYVSTLPVLVAFPMIVAGLSIAARGILEFVQQRGELERVDEFQTIYEILVLMLLSVVVASQLIIIVLNL